MAVREIITYGDPVLKKKASKITVFDASVKELFDDLLDTMYSANGVGLAANQIGVTKMALVIDTGTFENPRVLRLANPVVASSSREKAVFEEGCLSFPGLTEKIERPSVITVKAQDENGEELMIEASGLEAVALQHEIDHLNGVVFIYRMSPVKRMLHNKELKEIKKLGKNKK
ncbi:MAG TPA: peptide deformylase [bacterium]|nr:peptide deformylase [bacterium]